jgi:hypothetical protein
MSTNDHSPKGTPAKVQTPAAGAPPPRDTYAIQRRGTRVLMQDSAPVQLHLRGADLLDISLSGALVEHTVGVRVGEVYRLFFPVQGVEVEVLARAVRSFVSRVAPVSGGEGQVVYRTGLEFIELKESMAKTLSAYLEDLHQQTASWRSAGPAARVPEERTKDPSSEDSNKGMAARPSGRGSAFPANQPTHTNPGRRAWSRWTLAGILILGGVLVPSLLYLAGTHAYNTWSSPRALVTAPPGPATPMAESGGEPLPALPSRARGSVRSELATLGLLPMQQGLMGPALSESVAAHVLGSFSQPMQAGAGSDLWPLVSDLSSILGLRVALPQWPPAGDKGDSPSGVTKSTVAPTQPQPPAELQVAQEGNVAPDPSPAASPDASQTSNLLTALPSPVPTRPESSSVPTLRERTPPSGRVQPTPESPSPRQDQVPRKVTNFRGVDLRGADLRGADLQNADLRGAKLTPPDQAAKEGEAVSEAIAMVPTPAEARPGIPPEILDPRRTVAKRPREDEPR